MAKEKPPILIIDDEADMQETLRSILKKDYAPQTAASGEEGLSKLRSGNFDLILLDIRMPRKDGLAVLAEIKELESSLPVIMVTASKDIKSAVEAMKLGAEDFISKPFEVIELLAIVEKALQKRQLEIENRALKEILAESEAYGDLIGKSPKISKIKELIKQIAPTDSTVLITGESGTGKEIAAKALHKISPRKNKPFIAINCAAIPENLLESELFGHERGAFTGAMERRLGKFELADQGTIFLDEIGCMSPAMQSKLLRVLEDQIIERVGGTSPIQVDVRVISATNIDFKKHISEGKFREDLYYRLNVIPVQMPPMRERKEDLPLFISYFLEKYNKDLNKKIKGLDPAAQALLSAYDFPGNVRELKNIIERAVALGRGEFIAEENLLGLSISPDPAVSTVLNLKDACDEFERNYVRGALKAAGGNQSKAAQILGVARTTLSSKIEALGV